LLSALSITRWSTQPSLSAGAVSTRALPCVPAPDVASNRDVTSYTKLARLNGFRHCGYPLQGDTILRMNTKHIHESHPDIVKRLKRVEGHLHRVIEMIEEGRSCLDLAQQLHAVEKAVGQAQKALIHDHVDHCLDAAVSGRGGPTRAVLGEFKAISKYL
jgi:DNA-binding FrmR family transcriptional regulator